MSSDKSFSYLKPVGHGLLGIGYYDHKTRKTYQKVIDVETVLTVYKLKTLIDEIKKDIND